MYDFPETIALSNGASRFLDITDSLGHSSSPGGWGRRILDDSRQNLRYLPIRLCNIFITPPLPSPPYWQLIGTQFFIVHHFYSFSDDWFPHAPPENRVISKITSLPPLPGINNEWSLTHSHSITLTSTSWWTLMEQGQRRRPVKQTKTDPAPPENDKR